MFKTLESLNIEKLQLNNRLVMAPLETRKGNEDSTISEDIIEFYNDKSKGGYLSLIIVEHSFVSKEGMAAKRQLSVAEDKVVDGLERLANTIHSNGVKCVVQISHAGSATNRETTGFEPIGPSMIENPRKQNIPRAITKEEIKGLVEKFTKAAIRVKNAGFDGVEIHSAHGYFLNQFFSPLTNKRDDEYGGDVHGRIKIHLEIIKSIREAVGDEFPIFLRLGACDFMEGGTTIEESKIAAVEFEKAGVDVLDISGGFNGYTSENGDEEGYFHPLSSGIKEVVSIPVILTGGVVNVEAAEKLLKEEKCDLIGIGRALLKDSEWAKKAVKHLMEG